MEEKRLPNQKDSSIIIILMLFIMTIVSILVQAFFQNGSQLYLYLGFLIPQIVYILGIIIYYKLRNIEFKLNIKENFIKNKKLYPFAILMGIGLVFFAIPINELFVKLFSKLGFENSLTIPNNSYWYDYILSIIIIGILPAIGEEMLYRKALGDGIEKIGTIKAIIFMGLIFSLGHLNIMQTIHQFVLGCLFALIYLTTKDLSFTIIAHATNNILVVLLYYLVPDSFYSNIFVIIFGTIFGLIIALLSLKIILNKKVKMKKGEEKINIYLIILILILAILWIVVAIAS